MILRSLKGVEILSKAPREQNKLSNLNFFFKEFTNLVIIYYYFTAPVFILKLF